MASMIKGFTAQFQDLSVVNDVEDDKGDEGATGDQAGDGDDTHAVDEKAVQVSIHEQTSRAKKKKQRKKKRSGAAAEQEVYLKFGGGPEVETLLPCPDTLIDRGVDVEWLKRWTDRHNLWGMKTEDVVNQVVKPLTMHLKCRFVELASQVNGSDDLGGGGGVGLQSRSVVGKAHCFASHCWQCPFGDLVAAASDNSRPGRRIWLDIFAVNQHDVAFMSADLQQLAGCISEAPEGIMMCLNAETALRQPLLNPLRRIWCVFEVYNCLAVKKPLVIKLGRAALTADRGMVWHRDWEHQQVFQLAEQVDVEKADSTKLEDKERILAELSGSGLLSEVNRCLHTAVWNAYTSRGQTAYHYAVQGAEVLGWAMLLGAVEIESINPEGWTALHSAAYSGQSEVVSALLYPHFGGSADAKNESAASSGEGEWQMATTKKKSSKAAAASVQAAASSAPRGADVNARDGKGRTPAFSAAWQGQLESLKLLVAHPDIDLSFCDEYNVRPIDRVQRCLDAKGIGKNALRPEQRPEYEACLAFLTEAMTKDGSIKKPKRSPQKSKQPRKSSTPSSRQSLEGSSETPPPPSPSRLSLQRSGSTSVGNLEFGKEQSGVLLLRNVSDEGAASTDSNGSGYCGGGQWQEEPPSSGGKWGKGKGSGVKNERRNSGSVKTGNSIGEGKGKGKGKGPAKEGK